MKPISHAQLYGILDLDYVAVDNAVAMTRQLVDGGVDILQLRAKNASQETILEVGKSIIEISQDGGVPFIINDFPEIAVKLGADGLHIGQDDGDMTAIRSIVGHEMIVGRSTHSASQAAAAATDSGTDYIGFGPLFPTATKPDRPAIGLDEIRAVHAAHPQLPIFCIGGVKLESLPTILEAGAHRVVIVSDMLHAADVGIYISEIRSILGRYQ